MYVAIGICYDDTGAFIGWGYNNVFIPGYVFNITIKLLVKVVSSVFIRVAAEIPHMSRFSNFKPRL